MTSTKFLGFSLPPSCLHSGTDLHSKFPATCRKSLRTPSSTHICTLHNVLVGMQFEEKRSGIPFQYLFLLNDEINTWRETPIPLLSFRWLNTQLSPRRALALGPKWWIQRKSSDSDFSERRKRKEVLHLHRNPFYPIETQSTSDGGDHLMEFDIEGRIICVLLKTIPLTKITKKSLLVFLTCVP